MGVKTEKYLELVDELQPKNITLIAVSKIRTLNEILEMYQLGQRDFGENYVQELVDKQQQLPKDIRWHFIGHLQSNKVKYVGAFVHLIHGIDSFKLLKEVNKQAKKNNRTIDVLLQVHIAKEETKFGLDEKELEEILITKADELQQLENIKIVGLMGMASFTDDEERIRNEFEELKNYFRKYSQVKNTNCNLQVLSTGMSSDYKIAIEKGSTMVRIGSLIFGERNYAK